MPFRLLSRFFRRVACILTLCLWASFSFAQTGAFYDGEEDTILVEKEVTHNKIPYHRILKSISKQLFQIDVGSVLTFGKTRRDVIVRNFQDYAGRIKYRLNVDKDEVEVKLSLNF